MQRVAELRKEGLWSSRRLPKVQEPPRNKGHWDYLLEEMQWLAADFQQERKWKKAAARKVCPEMMSNMKRFILSIHVLKYNHYLWTLFFLFVYIR